MTLRDFVIVGSGPAGAAAALQLAGEDVLMLDVGMTPPPVADAFRGDLNVLRRSAEDVFPLLVGEAFESPCNLGAPRKRNLKLKAPFLSYIVRGTKELTPILSNDFAGDISLAKGGLANAWGAGLYRFTDEDLERFPLAYEDLRPFYDDLTRHIGISGTHDDLQPWFHRDDDLLPPLSLSAIGRVLLDRYERRRRLFHDQGVYIGQARLGVLTREHRGRTPYRYENQEFFLPGIPSVYTPAYTIDELATKGQLDYRPGHLVESFQENPDGVVVRARVLETNETKHFFARKLLLAAGAINTARIVLTSRQDFETKLPILDNPLTAFPLFNLSMAGSAPDRFVAPLTQLNVVVKGLSGIGTIQASFYNVTGSLRSDIIADLPVPLGPGRQLLKYLSSCFGLVMCFYPGRERDGSYLKLTTSNAVEVRFADEPWGVAEQHLIRLFRRVRYFSHPSLVVAPGKGSGLHYAGSLPMRAVPRGPYECFPDGRLNDTKGVFVLDAAGFSALPAKNLSLTIMANSMRIAGKLTP